MKNKSIPLLIAIVCGTIAAIGLSQWMQAQGSVESGTKMVEIFVTSKTIDITEEITADKIRLEQWPADKVPKGSSGDLKSIEGKFARQRFYEGEPIMPVKLMDDSNGSSQTIPIGYTVVSMRAETDGGVATLVRPGDRVDVTAYFKKSELIPESTAKTILTSVRVFAVDGRIEREKTNEAEGSARSISLLIHKNDARAWTYASELGNIRLSLGNPGETSDPGQDANGNAAGQEFLTWLKDYQEAQAARQVETKAVKPTPVVRATPKKKGFTMVKMSGGVLSEYWIAEGTNIPVLVGDSDKGSGASSGGSDGGYNNTSEMTAPVDYSYLNGSSSPFYSPPSGGSTASGDSVGGSAAGDDDMSEDLDY